MFVVASVGNRQTGLESSGSCLKTIYIDGPAVVSPTFTLFTYLGTDSDDSTSKSQASYRLKPNALFFFTIELSLKPDNHIQQTMSVPQRKLLITGATGKQGGGVIDALQASAESPFQILALTRNAQSASSKSLAAKPNVTVVEGESINAASIFEAHKPIYGVFSVTVIGKSPSEEEQAKPLIDAAIQNGVEHFIFASVDRGGAKSEDNPPSSPISYPSTTSRII